MLASNYFIQLVYKNNNKWAKCKILYINLSFRQVIEVEPSGNTLTIWQQVRHPRYFYSKISKTRTLVVQCNTVGAFCNKINYIPIYPQCLSCLLSQSGGFILGKFAFQMREERSPFVCVYFFINVRMRFLCSIHRARLL